MFEVTKATWTILNPEFNERGWIILKNNDNCYGDMQWYFCILIHIYIILESQVEKLSLEVRCSDGDKC